MFWYKSIWFNTSFVYCCELAPGTVSLTGDWVHGDDSKQTLYYNEKKLTRDYIYHSLLLCYVMMYLIHVYLSE